MYEEMRADMEKNEWGRMVVIDVNSGDYEVADDDLTAIRHGCSSGVPTRSRGAKWLVIRRRTIAA